MSATKVIVSYDGTNNEDDAIALGRLLHNAGAEIALGYVRHTHEPEPDREVLAQHEAETLLTRGAELLGAGDIARYVVSDRSTPEGLRALAEREGADLIVFCSDSHTAPRHVSVGNSAQRLLDGGRFAIAIASAGLADRESSVKRIAATEDPTDPSAQQTAQALAEAFGAEGVSAVKGHGADLLVVGSRPEAGHGQVALSAAAQNLIEDDAGAVLVVPRGVALAFGRAVSLSA
ncbi:MAG TPA: universal stress protein [Solirubrobacteraceae bacterium]|jgi:nucleotide-binding universal stress UspA family protein